MPYALVTARLSPSVSTSTTPPFRILTSWDRYVRDKLISVLPCLASQYKESSPVTRTPAPITFPVHKSLKSSIGCSSTGSFGRSKETAPPTHLNVRRDALPLSSRKSVRFKGGDDGLESICFFQATERPSALLNPDSDTEPDAESNDASSIYSPQCLVLANAAIGETATAPLLKITDLSPIPSSRTPSHSFIRLESISPLLAGARPPLLRGIVRVRNIAFEKCVAARFTIDDWSTVSEVLARYAGPGDDDAWDRFAFSISLEFYAPRPPRPATGSSSLANANTFPHSHSHARSHAFTLHLAVRYSVPGVGEWWDNNGGDDFHIVLAHADHASAGSKTPAVGPTPTAEFLRRLQGVTCFGDAQATMAYTRSLKYPYVAPAPTVVTN